MYLIPSDEASILAACRAVAAATESDKDSAEDGVWWASERAFREAGLCLPVSGSSPADICPRHRVACQAWTVGSAEDFRFSYSLLECLRSGARWWGSPLRVDADGRRLFRVFASAR